MRIEPQFTEVIDLSLDTINLGKQAIIFVSSKRSAEKQAEDVAKKLPVKNVELAQKIGKVLSSPTKQCERLSFCIARGTAFHHAGLHSKQRELIEDGFKEGSVAIIAATPTLAAGVDLPAYRAILKDLKRYTHRGMDYIPVLEYLQMAGRAGRPSYDTEGQAICIATNERQRDELLERYLHGEPEAIYSKLAAEPVLRTYVLSLLVTGIVKTREDLLSFFGKTFFGHQYGDMKQLGDIIDRVIFQLREWQFLKKTEQSDFMSADALVDGAIEPTMLGKRVAELYLDPYTAFQLLERLQVPGNHSSFVYAQAIAHTLEMRPLLRVKAKEMDYFEGILAEHEFLEEESFDYDEHAEMLNSIKTACFLSDWMDEKRDEFLLEKYDIRPGEVRAKLQIMDWLCYGASELSRIALIKNRNELAKLRLRLKHGVKEELLPLIRLENIGRGRARKLFNAGIKDVADLKKASPERVKGLLGEKIGENVLRQLRMG